MPTGDRVNERRRAAALARHYRDEEGLSIAEIAQRLGRAEATVKAYLYDPSDANKRPWIARRSDSSGRLLVMHGRRSASRSSALAATARVHVPDCPICPGAEVSSVVIAAPPYCPYFVDPETRRTRLRLLHRADR
jgi:Sigma-70, region 4